MAPKLKELKNLSDEQIAERYDKKANELSGGPSFYLDILNRRFQERHTKSISRLTVRIAWMTFVMTICTILNTAFFIFGRGGQ
jgi:hypothetical protein